MNIFYKKISIIAKSYYLCVLLFGNRDFLVNSFLIIINKIENKNIEVTILARGVAIGDELQYTDEITLGQSIINRKPFEK